MESIIDLGGQSLLNTIVRGTSGHVGKEFFENLVICIVRAVHVKHVIVTECLDVEKTRLRTLAYAENTYLKENVEYDTEGTPCKLIMQSKKPLYIPHEVQKEFPAEEGVECYMGVPILNSHNEMLGHIAVLHERHFAFSDEKIEILKIFAARCAAEIERISAERQLKAIAKENQRLRKLLSIENSYLRDELAKQNIYSRISSKSNRLKSVIQLVEKVAKTKSTVLLTGETGTGKGVFADTIHRLSNRNRRAMIKVNCATLPKELIESELFGHEKGSFTGAQTRKTGKFEVAEGSTIFLDEIGELPLDQQVKLLKVLQEREFDRVGGTKPIKTDVRVIAATNRDLALEVEKGNFRSDLYYRLNVFPIHLPPLRERKEDLFSLVDFFIKKHGNEISEKLPEFDQRSLKLIQDYDWPGNIRELENVVERALILFDGKKLTLDQARFIKPDKDKGIENPTLEEMEKSYILDVLQRVNYKISGTNSASEILKINPNTLYSKMKKLGIR